MGVAYRKGMFLFQQRRWRAAAEQFQLDLAENPSSSQALSMLALSHVNDAQFEPAHAAACEALRANPELAQAHWAMANVVLRRKPPRRWYQHRASDTPREQRKRLHATKKELLEAIRLNSSEPAFFELLGAIEMDLRHWRAALEAAEQGLRINPQHLGCANLRAMLLAQLGRAKEARAEIDRSLGIDPEHALTHRNRGWVLLQSGDVAAATAHFESSLRNNPNDRRAQSGLRHARRARFAPYRWILRFGLWSSRPGNRWIVIVGAMTTGLSSGLYRDHFHLTQNYALLVAIAQGIVVMAILAAVLNLIRAARWRWKSRRRSFGVTSTAIAQTTETP